MTPQAFAETRAAAITAYGRGRNTKWTVLGLGIVGDLGAVRVRDQYNEDGLVVQKWAGAGAGMTSKPDPRYVETIKLDS